MKQEMDWKNSKEIGKKLNNFRTNEDYKRNGEKEIVKWIKPIDRHSERRRRRRNEKWYILMYWGEKIGIDDNRGRDSQYNEPSNDDIIIDIQYMHHNSYTMSHCVHHKNGIASVAFVGIIIMIIIIMILICCSICRKMDISCASLNDCLRSPFSACLFVCFFVVAVLFLSFFCYFCTMSASFVTQKIWQLMNAFRPPTLNDLHRDV